MKCHGRIHPEITSQVMLYVRRLQFKQHIRSLSLGRFPQMDLDASTVYFPTKCVM